MPSASSCARSPLPAKRGEIFDRRGRLLAYSVDADTIYAVPSRSRTPTRPPRRCAARSTTARARSSRRSPSGSAADRALHLRQRRRVTPLEARKVAALKLDGIGFMKESRRFYPNKELAAHLLGYVGARQRRAERARSRRTTRSSAAKRARCIAQTDARRQAFAAGSSGRRRPADRSSSPSTSSCSTSSSASCAPASKKSAPTAAAPSSSIPQTGRDPRDGELADVQPERLQRVQPRSARRNRAVQDIYEPGSTFKVVTVAAALEENVMPLDAMHRHQPRRHSLRGPRHRRVRRPQLRRAVAHRRHRQVEQRRRDQDWPEGRAGAARAVHATASGSASRPRPTSPARARASSGPAAKLNDSALASMSMGYQVGVTPLQMAAAMNAVANGGTWIEPRIVRAVVQRRRAHAESRPRSCAARSASETARRAAADSRSGRRATAPAKPAQVAGLHRRRQDRHGRQARQRPLRRARSRTCRFSASCRRAIPALTVIVMIDTPRVGSDTGGAVAAPIFKRIAEARCGTWACRPTSTRRRPSMVARRRAEPRDPDSRRRRRRRRS